MTRMVSAVIAALVALLCGQCVEGIFVSPNQHEMRPVHFAEIIPIEQNISVEISTSDFPQIFIKMEMDFMVTDASVNFIPLMSPRFYQRRFYLQTEGEEGTPPFVNRRKFYMLKYNNQFFTPDHTYRLSVTATRPLQYGKYGLQMRTYTDVFTKEGDVYFFTNLFPYNVHHMIPNTSNKRMTYVSYNITYWPGYDTISYSDQNSTIFKAYNASTEEIIAVTLRNVRYLNYTWEHNFVAVAKPDHKGEFPEKLLLFVNNSYTLFEERSHFLEEEYVGSVNRSGIKIVILPMLNIKPLVLGREMCIFDEEMVVTQPENNEYLMTLCIQHQYFSRSLRAFSPDLFFIDMGLRGLYGILYLDTFEERMNDYISSFLNWEREAGLGLRLMDYSYDMKEPARKRYEAKSIGIVSMLRSALNDFRLFNEFVGVIMGHGIDYTLYSIVDLMKLYHDDFHFGEEFNIIAMFKTWMNSTGYPLLYFARIQDRLAMRCQTTSVNLHNYFLFPVKIMIPELDTYKVFNITWADTINEYKFNLTGSEKFYLVNPGHEAPFRVNYDEANWDKIVVNFKELKERDKGAIVSDSYFFFKREELDLIYVIRLLRQLKKEASAVAWKGVEYFIIDLDAKLRFTYRHQQFHAFLMVISRKFYSYLSYHNSGLAIMFACMAVNPFCLSDARRQTINYLITGEEMANREQILCAGMRFMDDDIYDYLMHISYKENREKKIILLAMTCNEKRQKIANFIRAIFRPGHLKILNDFKMKLIIHVCMASQTGVSEVWDYFLHHHAVVYSIVSREQFHQICILLSQYLKHKFQYRYMRSILVLYDYPLETVLNNILQNQLFIEEHERKMMTELFVE